MATSEDLVLFHIKNVLADTLTGIAESTGLSHSNTLRAITSLKHKGVIHEVNTPNQFRIFAYTKKEVLACQ